MTFTNTDSENLARIAAALERVARAEEQRNEILRMDRHDRTVSWAKFEQDNAAALKAIVGAPFSIPVESLK